MIQLSNSEIIESLRGGLIVSCQAYPGEPMNHPATMAQVAASVVGSGAVAIRAQGLADIARISEELQLPVIGLWKDGAEGVLITPTLEHALAVARAGSDIVALDGTRRPRPDGLTLAQTVRELRAQMPDVIVMADCGSLPDAEAAVDAGADIIGTTLAGYSGERPSLDGPDLELIEQITARFKLPVIAEGRIHTPAEAAAAMRAGAFAVCVGSAITHPGRIATWFDAAIRGVTTL